MSDDGMLQRRARRTADGRAAAPTRGQRASVPAAGGDHARTRMERRQARRGGRALLEGWVLVAAAVVLVLIAAGGARAVVKAATLRSAASAAAKLGAAPAVVVGSGETSAPATTVFAKMGRYGVAMHFPAIASDMVAIGFHQAWNLKATDMRPTLKVHPKDEYADTKAALKGDRGLKLFEMMSRGRGSSEYSAADCAVKPGAIIMSPVSGVVTLVTTYHLADVGTDYRVEIKADGAAPVRVVMIHLQDITVRTGERVEGGVTPIATVRHLPIDNQVNRYLPVAADHTHIQINAVGYKLNESS